MKKKSKSKKKEITLVKPSFKGLFLILSSLAFLIFSVLLLYSLKATQIRVEGNNYLNNKYILEKTKLKKGVKYITSSKSVCKGLSDNPFISNCKIEHTLSGELIVKIKENKPLFYYEFTNELILDNQKRSGGDNVFNVPTLINFVPEDVLNTFIDKFSKIDTDIIHSVSDIEYSPSTNKDGKYIDEERFILTMNDGNIININNLHLDVLNLYNKIYASIGDRKGTFYFDCAYGNYFFTEFNNG